jgi:hypothetical protein
VVCNKVHRQVHSRGGTNWSGIEAGKGGKDADTKTNRPTPAAAASCKVSFCLVDPRNSLGEYTYCRVKLSTDLSYDNVCVTIDAAHFSVGAEAANARYDSTRSLQNIAPGFRRKDVACASSMNFTFNMFQVRHKFRTKYLGCM